MVTSLDGPALWNALAGTSGLSEVNAANVWAGTTGLDLPAAVSAKTGYGPDIPYALSRYAGIATTDVNIALQALIAGGAPPADPGDTLLLESGDDMLLESGDFMLLE